MGKHKDSSKFDKGTNCDGKTTGSEHLQNCSSYEMFPVCSGQYLSKVIQRTNSGEPATGSRVAKAQ